MRPNSRARLISVLVALGLIVGLAPGASAAPETGPRRGFIILLNASAGDPRSVAADHAQAYDGEVGFVYSHALKGYSMTMPEGRLTALEHDPRVAAVQPEQEISIAAQLLPTGVDRIQADKSPIADIDGIDERVDVDIAIIDTGIDLTHPDLNVVASTDCTAVTSLTGCVDGLGTDGHGHGTHVAGVAAAVDNDAGTVGVAPGARLHAVKVLGPTGTGTNAGLVAGIDWVAAHASEIEVANLSLSNRGAGYDFVQRKAIANAVAMGVVFVAAAGNESRDVYGADGTLGTADDTSPAAFPEAMTISALADMNGSPGGTGIGTYGISGCTEALDDSFACFSNYSRSVDRSNPVDSSGGAIDLMLPGLRIYSTYKNGGYSTMSGTSQAAPHAAGLAALYIAGHGRAQDAAEVYALRQALIAEGMPQLEALATLDDPDLNPERVGRSLPPPQSFADVPIGSWAHPYVEAIYKAGIASGCSYDQATGKRLFCPTDRVTRAQIAAFIGRAMGASPLIPAAPTFVDVAPEHWAYGWIEALYQKGVVTGCSFDEATGERRYCPSNSLTRAQMAAFLMKARGEQELAPLVPSFTDVLPDHWAYGWIERLRDRGVTQGCTDTAGIRMYCPSDALTRNQMAVFLARTWDLMP